MRGARYLRVSGRDARAARNLAPPCEPLDRDRVRQPQARSPAIRPAHEAASLEPVGQADRHQVAPDEAAVMADLHPLLGNIVDSHRLDSPITRQSGVGIHGQAPRAIDAQAMLCRQPLQQRRDVDAPHELDPDPRPVGPGYMSPERDRLREGDLHLLPASKLHRGDHQQAGVADVAHRAQAAVARRPEQAGAIEGGRAAARPALVVPCQPAFHCAPGKSGTGDHQVSRRHGLILSRGAAARLIC